MTPLRPEQRRHLSARDVTTDHQFRLPALPLRVVDGDTIEMFEYRGHKDFSWKSLRLLGVDTHEIHSVSHDSEEYERGIEERDFVISWLLAALGDSYEINYTVSLTDTWPLQVQTYGVEGKFGRVLGDIRYPMADGPPLLTDVLLDTFDDIEYDD